ncbi:MAG: DUF5711 family protein [Clostridiales bacterium]|nr:DUF5711 family protein [Clostridiales bacterium]
MSDMSSMSRENKKRQLRRQIVFSQEAAGRSGMHGDKPDNEEIVRQAQSRARRRRLLIVIILLLIVAVGAVAYQIYQRFYRYVSFETSWEIALNEGSLVGYETFGTNVLKYTKDGVSYIDNQGKTVWTESYEMKTPIVAVNGDFAAIADQQGNSIYICDLDGRQGQAATILPVSRIAISGTGVVAAVLEDTTSSYITFFRRDGSSLDITIKTNMAGDGYPLDLALSQDGTQLLCSYVYIENGEMKTRIVFYDFSEVGKNVPTREVGIFIDPFQGTMAPEVTYLKSPYSCVFTGNGAVFFSSQNLASPQIVAQADLVDSTIESVFCSDDYAAMILRENVGENTSRLEVYRADGTHVMTKEFDYEYDKADIDGNLIFLYNENSCKIFNMAGREKLYAEFDFPISRIRRGRFPNTLILTGSQQMREIRLK